MAFKIIQEGKDLTEVFRGKCIYCNCVFEFNKEDVKSEFFDQREEYNVLYLNCPHCKRYIGIAEDIIRYE